LIDPAQLGAAAPTLVAPRLQLRALRADDAPALFALFSDEEAMRFWSEPPHADATVTRAMIERTLARFAKGEGVEWALVRAGDDRAIGKMAIWRWQREHSRGEVGYILRRDLWGQGLAGEALQALVRFAFGPLGLHSLEAQLDGENAGSVRTLERAGFRREGWLRQAYFDPRKPDGERWRDTLIYGLLAGEVPPPAGSMAPPAT
jgi:ribosomal-protein-alanine N-acetyltransferase